MIVAESHSEQGRSVAMLLDVQNVRPLRACFDETLRLRNRFISI